MTRKYIQNSFIALVLLSIFTVTPALANDIYIEQVGDTLDLDITQDGANNVIGTSTTDVNLDGDSMTFAITQTGSFNTIAADIQGNTYTGTWAFTGDSNAVDLSCDSTSGTNCENITLNITATGDSNTFDFNVGDVSDADGSTISFTVTGDNNIVNTDVDGQSAALTVTVDNSASTSINSDNSDEGVAITTTQSGNGDSQGMGITLGVTGGGGKIDITQSGINDNIVDLTISGDDFDVDISQTD